MKLLLLSFAFLAFLPLSATGQPLSLLPNELYWFTRNPDQPADRQDLAKLLARVPGPKLKEPWRDLILVVGWPGFDDANVKDVTRMNKLTHLWFRQSSFLEQKASFRISAAGWSRLRELKDLRVLGISDAELDDSSLAEIGKLTELDTLYLDCQCSDAGLAKLRNLKKLVHLCLNVRGAKVTDACAQDIAGFEGLKDLSICNSTISDAGVKKLAKLRRLRSLEIGSNALSDEAFKEIAGMNRMVAVALASDRVTPNGIEQLWKARPDLLMINGAGIPARLVPRQPADARRRGPAAPCACHCSASSADGDVAPCDRPRFAVTISMKKGRMPCNDATSSSPAPADS